MLSDSPAGYWRLGESSGVAADDATGNGLSGTYAGGFTLGQAGAVLGDADGAVLLDGSTGYVSVADAAPLRLASAWSVEAWVYFSSADNYPVVVNKGNTLSRNYNLYVQGGDRSAVLVMTQGAGSYKGMAGATALGLNAWHHLVGTYDGWRCAVRGREFGRLHWPRQAGRTRRRARWRSGEFGTGSNWLSGRVDEVAVYAAALSAGRVAAHYHAAAG